MMLTSLLIHISIRLKKEYGLFTISKIQKGYDKLNQLYWYFDDTEMILFINETISHLFRSVYLFNISLDDDMKSFKQGK